MKPHNLQKVQNLIEIVNHKIQGIEMVALVDENRAYGGIIRATKGKVLEELCKELLKVAWSELGGRPEDISFSDVRVPIPLKREYLDRIQTPELRKWIEENYSDFVFNAQVDVHVEIRGEFVLGVECKAYTENAMLKRILVDFTLLKSIYPKLKCGLLQLESQLTGDYSEIYNDIIYGSHSSHTLMSYFDVDLNIMTLLPGERHVNRPIHREEYFKDLEITSVEKTIEKMKELLKDNL